MTSLEDRIRASFPTEEQLAERRRSREEDRKARSAADLFNPVNLGHWIALCEKAGVPYVPAEEVARIPTGEIVCFDADPCPPSVPAFFEAVEQAMAARGDNWMLRWSCCACDEVKYRLGKGMHEWHEDVGLEGFRIDDFRAYDLVSSFPEETIAAYARPWVKAAIVDSYPVEYRVFVSHDVIDGISSYYPQRPLPNNARALYDIAVIFRYAARLIEAQKKRLNCPPMEKHWDLTQNHWTADFIRTADDNILFLEGGPPHTPSGGAHPCCFPIGKTDGIALKAAPEELEAMGLGVEI